MSIRSTRNFTTSNKIFFIRKPVLLSYIITLLISLVLTTFSSYTSSIPIDFYTIISFYFITKYYSILSLRFLFILSLIVDLILFNPLFDAFFCNAILYGIMKFNSKLIKIGDKKSELQFFVLYLLFCNLFKRFICIITDKNINNLDSLIYFIFTFVFYYIITLFIDELIKRLSKKNHAL
jgi:hypothetical protein